MKIRVGVVNPIITKEFEDGTRQEIKNYERDEVTIEVYTIKKGPASIECRYDEACAVPGVIETVRDIKEDVNAVVINCFGDPGVESAREITRVPVVGPGTSSMLLASLLGDSFSVITVLQQLEPLIKEIAYRCGVLSKLGSVRAANVPVLELEKDRNRLIEILVRETINAIEKDGAHVAVLGCTGMAGLAKAVKDGLNKHGYDIPILDPLAVAIKQAIVLAELGVCHSRLTYPEPPEKYRKW